jgi:hypothetical protein
MAPRRRAPRNFTLTPAMIGDQGPGRVQSFFRGWFPTLSFASAVATFALVASLLFQLIPGTSMTAQSPDSSRTAEQQAAAPQAPAAQSTAGQVANVPPMILWNGSGSDVTGKVPSCPGGMCGGAADSGPAFGMGGAGIGGGGGGGGGSSWVNGGVPDGQLNIPPDGLQTMTEKSAQDRQFSAVQPDPSISGAGPILGVPPAENSGQIIKLDSSVGSVAVGSSIPLNPTTPETQPAAPRTLLGLPLVRFLQILLALLAVSTGLAALIVRKRA